MSSPADIEDDRDINPDFIHTGDELIGGSYFGVRVGVEDGKTWVTLDILTAFFLYLGWEYMGMKVNNHRQIIAEAPE